MPTYDSQITRGDAQALIPEQYIQEIFGYAEQASVVLQNALRLPDAANNQVRIPVWATLPVAYWTSGDTGLHQTSEFSWQNVYANVEELNCIVPIPNHVLEDSAYDIIGMAKPKIGEAMAAALDLAVIDGTNKPSGWTFDDLVTGCVNSGNVVTYDSHVSSGGDIYSAVLGVNGTMQKVELDGCAINGHVASLAMKGYLRGLRGEDGHPVFQPAGQNAPAVLGGAPIYFPENGGVNPLKVMLISGDWKKVAVTMRKAINFRVLTEAVIQDGAGAIVYNLAQQNMAALQCTMRLGVARMNPPNLVNPNSSTRHPFVLLRPTTP